MKNIIMLTTANLRKNKSQAISLMVFVLITAMFLNIGLVLLFGLGGFIDQRAEENNAAHVTAIYSYHSGILNDVVDYFKSYPGVTETEVLELVGGMGSYFIQGLQSTSYIYFSPAHENQTMDRPSLIGEYLPLTGDNIYIPNFLMLGGDYKLGDNIKLMLSGTEQEFIVAGATEEIMFGAQFNGIHRFYVSDERYAKLTEEFPNDGVTFISVRLENFSDDIYLYLDHSGKNMEDGLHFVNFYSNARNQRAMIPNIASIVITVFSLILLTVSLIVIRFRIVNSIEENMTNIGAQKAIGFRSIQIVLSILFQFTGISLVGGIAGIAAAQIALPIIARIFKPMIALVWIPMFDLSAVLISLLAVILTVSLISFLTAKKISKLQPLVALRGGIAAHNFRKNSFPLEKSRIPLDFLLALKQLAQSKKQAVAISIIIAVLSMASVAGVAVSYNMSGTGENFARAFFGELPEAAFMLRDGKDGDTFLQHMRSRFEVRKAFGYDYATTYINDYSIGMIIVEDCSLLEGNLLVNGRYPIHSNEIAIGASVSSVTGKGIGDTVVMQKGDMRSEYLITGTIQLMHWGGLNGIVTGEGILEIYPEFKFASFFIYLNEDVDINALINSVITSEGDIFESTANVSEDMEATIAGMSGIFSTVTVGIIAVTGFIVILVLYMIIKTTVLQKKRELGIQKAVGFTSLQLMNQIALNMTPKIIFGVILGAILGYFGLNPMMAAFMSGMGIVRADLPVPVGQTLILCAGLIIFAYAVSILISLRIRKISAYALVVE